MVPLRATPLLVLSLLGCLGCQSAPDPVEPAPTEEPASEEESPSEAPAPDPVETADAPEPEVVRIDLDGPVEPKNGNAAPADDSRLPPGVSPPKAPDLGTFPPTPEPPEGERELASRYAEALELRLADGPRNPAEVARLCRLWLEAGKPAKARELLLAGPPKNAGPEVMAQWAATQLAVGEVDAAVESLEAALAAARPGSGLKLRDLAFCGRVMGFAAYKPLASNILRRGQTVRLYVEVMHAAPVEEAEKYRLRLGVAVRVLDDSGEAVWTRPGRHELNLHTHRSPNDVFVTVPFKVPTALGPGRYDLELTVHEESSSQPRNATSKIDFEVR